MTRILIAGGYGVVGGWIARELRNAHPGVELVLGGRNADKGAALAAEVGAIVAQLDVADPEANLAQIGALDLVIGSLRDPDDNLAIAALRRGAAFTTIVRPPETMSAVAVAAERGRRPALMLGHWQAGVMTLCALAHAKAFAQVDQIHLTALYDYADPIGPMTSNDSSAFFENGALIRRGGAWLRVDPATEARSVSRAHGPDFPAQPMSVLDTAGLVGATFAADVRFDLGAGDSMGTLSGHAASHEIYLELRGRDAAGKAIARQVVMSDPKGQAHLTALGVVVGAERLLGLDGSEPLRPGIAFPESAIDPEAAMRRLEQLGVSVETDARSTAEH